MQDSSLHLNPSTFPFGKYIIKFRVGTFTSQLRSDGEEDAKVEPKTDIKKGPRSNRQLLKNIFLEYFRLSIKTLLID